MFGCRESLMTLFSSYQNTMADTSASLREGWGLVLQAAGGAVAVSVKRLWDHTGHAFPSHFPPLSPSPLLLGPPTASDVFI